MGAMIAKAATFLAPYATKGATALTKAGSKGAVKAAGKGATQAASGAAKKGFFKSEFGKNMMWTVGISAAMDMIM